VSGLLGASLDVSYSLIGSNSGNGLAVAPVGSPDAKGNLVGGSTSTTWIQPRLGPLADNGGFELPDGSKILTHALEPLSPAINAGDPTAMAGVGGVSAHDQRGAPFTRVYGGRIDIGAVEALPAGFLPGDYDVDGLVGGLDYSVWRNTLGTSVAPGSGADGNGDGVVNSLDYAVWKSNFGAVAADLAPGTVEEAVAATSLRKETQPAPPVTLRLIREGAAGPSNRGNRMAVDSSDRDRLLIEWLATRDGARRRSVSR